MHVSANRDNERRVSASSRDDVMESHRPGKTDFAKPRMNATTPSYRIFYRAWTGVRGFTFRRLHFRLQIEKYHDEPSAFHTVTRFVYTAASVLCKIFGAIAKDSYLEISRHFGIYHLEQSIARRREIFFCKSTVRRTTIYVG